MTSRHPDASIRARSGLFMVGVALVMVGSFVAGAVVAAVIDTLRPDRPLDRPLAH
ncbi:hypothetical protein [Streptomyces sp. Ag109_O5-1]|uniref:hypothetical protein n=1 Tax=Streptomyces sp. Ag109_O5-1 TaxID=1938851 RepID=UPI001623C55D|nr:hypothetical protein [Streptomyces sp. Ag109_O5-1]